MFENRIGRIVFEDVGGRYFSISKDHFLFKTRMRESKTKSSKAKMTLAKKT